MAFGKVPKDRWLFLRKQRNKSKKALRRWVIQVEDLSCPSWDSYYSRRGCSTYSKRQKERNECIHWVRPMHLDSRTLTFFCHLEREVFLSSSIVKEKGLGCTAAPSIWIHFYSTTMNSSKYIFVYSSPSWIHFSVRRFLEPWIESSILWAAKIHV